MVAASAIRIFHLGDTLKWSRSYQRPQSIGGYHRNRHWAGPLTVLLTERKDQNLGEFWLCFWVSKCWIMKKRTNCLDSLHMYSCTPQSIGGYHWNIHWRGPLAVLLTERKDQDLGAFSLCLFLSVKILDSEERTNCLVLLQMDPCTPQLIGGIIGIAIEQDRWLGF